MEVAASWLSDDVLLASVPFEPFGADAVVVAADAGVSIDVRQLAYDSATLLLVRFVRPPAGGDPPALSIRTSAGETRIDLDRAILDLRSLCRERLAAGDRGARGRLVEFLAEALKWEHSRPLRVQLSRNLLLLRDALRERLPYSAAAAGVPAPLLVDAIVAADDRTFLVTAAASLREGSITSLTAVSPEGLRADLVPRLRRHPHRRFPGATGVTASCRFDAPSVLDDGWRMELRTATGDEFEVSAPRITRDLPGARRALLAGLADEGGPNDALIREHVFPGLDRLQGRLRAEQAVEQVVQYGTPHAAPDISVVIPFGPRTDLLEHQLAQFANDPEMLRTELVYVEDTLTVRERLLERAEHLHELYRVPFRIATLARAAGFAAAVDAGSKLARAPLMVLLASEAMPARPGWLSRLAACHRATPGTGAVVPAWLDVDDSARDPAPAPGAACLVIDAARFHSVGGLSGRYIQSDFEAADLCVRLGHRGQPTVRCPDVALYLVREEPRFGSQRRVEMLYDRWVGAYLHPAR